MNFFKVSNKTSFLGLFFYEVVLFLVLVKIETGYGIRVSINNNITGIEGTSWTIESSYTRENVYRFISANFQRKINNTFKTLIRFFFDREVYISSNGYYLRGRVSFDNITQSSNKVVVNFTNLLCIDQGEYRYLVYFENNDGTPDNNFSESTYIDVKVLPSSPTDLIVLKKYDAAQEDTTDMNGLSNLTFVENDTITATCSGEVGKPPANLTMQKILSNGTVYNLTTDNNLVNVELPNCTFYQNSTFTTTLSEEDNKSKLWCKVYYSENMFVETNQIVVLFPVRHPDIILYPSQHNNTHPLTLQCHGRGNPDPHYAWFRLNQTSGFEFFASTQNITLNTIADSGVYRCDVNNSIGDNVYRKSRNITLTFEAQVPTTTIKTTVFTSTQDIPNTSIWTTTTPKPTVLSSTHGNPKNDGACACDERNYVAGVLGGVFGTLAFCVVVSAIFCLWQKRSKKNLDKRPQITSIADQSLPSNYEGISEERTDHQYTELHQRNEHPYYSTPIEPTR